MLMQTSAAGRAKLMAREGSRLKAYADSTGVLTIGTGHTGRASPPKVTAGMTITQAQAEAFFEADLVPFEAAVNNAVTQPMTQNQFDAMVSLAFNVGAGGFTGSTVVRKFNAGDIQGAADAFLLWDKPAVLKTRREAERQQFLTPDRIAPSLAAPSLAAPALATPTLATPAVASPGAVSVPAAKPSLLHRLWSVFARKPAA